MTRCDAMGCFVRCAPRRVDDGLIDLDTARMFMEDPARLRDV